jgi:lipoprotein NlpD
MIERGRAGLVASFAVVAALVAGCGGSQALAPVGRAPPPADGAQTIYVVQRGDTLYSIAWRYGLDFRNVAAWNGIRSPYLIHPGQRIRLRGTPQMATVARAPPPPPPARARPRSDPSTTPATPRASPSPPSAAAAPARPPGAPSGTGRWQWPVRGEVIARFGQGDNKGIDIAGQFGQPIVAADDGEVVYAGGGLRGYGELIIVKHDTRYLSAYAHNDEVFVREGDMVKGGQRIATMGRSGADRVKLHFEIRRDGQPVDPLGYLPR